MQESEAGSEERSRFLRRGKGGEDVGRDKRSGHEGELVVDEFQIYTKLFEIGS